jgi:hypothetical protein
MPSRKTASPAHRGNGGRARIDVDSGGLDCSTLSKRSARRQYLARHLHTCGPRPVLEALLAVEGGQSLDTVLEDYGRRPAELFEVIDADLLPIDVLFSIGGRLP